MSTHEYGCVEGACANEARGEAVTNLAEAMYRASISDPYSDGADREYQLVKGHWQYMAIRALRWLQDESSGACLTGVAGVDSRDQKSGPRRANDRPHGIRS